MLVPTELVRTELKGSYSLQIYRFTDLQLGASATKIEASFGDAIFPGFPGSFRSVDGVQICVFNSEPVPEPTSIALALLGASFVLRRKRP